MLASKWSTLPVPNSTTLTPGWWRTKRYAASVRLLGSALVDQEIERVVLFRDFGRHFTLRPPASAWCPEGSPVG